MLYVEDDMILSAKSMDAVRAERPELVMGDSEYDRIVLAGRRYRSRPLDSACRIPQRAAGSHGRGG
ncbi:MAG: hypothetical protein VCC36_03680 [Gammaproteobacteria bacterium]